ncbi:MAG: sigma-70 family RNA polymerase sigma factor [Actinomycetota bacterium]|nr:sigma-70 family RNA polymerase sigma factor [Actinomycetota bacterium]
MRHDQRHDRFLAFYDDTFSEAYRYAGRLCGTDREAAEDLVQDAYASLLRRWRAGTAESGNDSDLQIAYLITTIRNRFLDRARTDEREQRRLRLVAAAGGERQPAVVPSQLAALPARERTALVLRYVDDLAVPDVAAAMDISVHAAESLLARARARLRGEEPRHA